MLTCMHNYIYSKWQQTAVSEVSQQDWQTQTFLEHKHGYYWSVCNGERIIKNTVSQLNNFSSEK